MMEEFPLRFGIILVLLLVTICLGAWNDGHSSGVLFLDYLENVSGAVDRAVTILLFLL